MSTKSAFAAVGLAHKVCLAAEEQGYNPELLNALAEDKTLLGQLLQVQLGLAKIVPSPLLKFGGRVVIPARPARFIPKENYVANTEPGPQVKFSYIDQDFIIGFGDKIEESTVETTLRYDILLRLSEFAPAIKELSNGGLITKSTPSELFSMLEKQPDGPNGVAGPLLVNGDANLFEMEDINGSSQLVNAYWYGYGWYVYSYPVTYAGQWNDGRQLFSRDSRERSGA